VLATDGLRVEPSTERGQLARGFEREPDPTSTGQLVDSPQ
jgi:hypothetical protein